MGCLNCNSLNLTITTVDGRELSYCNNCFHISYSKRKSGNGWEHFADGITGKVNVYGETEVDQVILLNMISIPANQAKFEQNLSEWCGKNYLSFKYSEDGKNVIFKRLVGVKPLPLRQNELARQPISIMNFDYPIIVVVLNFQKKFRIEGRVQGRLIPYPVYLADKSMFADYETPFYYFKSHLLSNQSQLLKRMQEYFSNLG
ncbi:hypothetical protein EHQ46_15810 [Leptospira yanagawae]|uniref:DUF4428 domain-containing protein n=1 Tax=Leptospira yanagawae TaxID=293069 RepID=A0ABY2M1X3_9LEPT|nr:hypothetical protein [Leptospira yanagawae]TGL17921.1 hypothetical protein EHQ46_15810 [Leptospira yanagawae]